jgi:hypothetical protein
VEAVNHLKVRSCLIDGEVVCCDERGLATYGTNHAQSSWWPAPSAIGRQRTAATN